MAKRPDHDRRLGRPRVLPEAGTPVMTWLSHGEHERLTRLAQANAKSISSYVRDVLQPKLKP